VGWDAGATPVAPLMPLLSIDPSSTKIGWALLNPGPTYLISGVHIVPKVPPEERVPYVGSGVTQLIQQWRPQSVLIEVPDFVTDRAMPHIVHYFRSVGATELAVHLQGVPIYHVTASIDKDKQRKTKAEVFFRQVTGRPPTTDDESDALMNGWQFIGSLPASPVPPLMPVGGPQTHDDDEGGYGWDECIDEGPDGF
jgi:Holliday junction resolvasome RuvABC endonuclease subunit